MGGVSGAAVANMSGGGEERKATARMNTPPPYENIRPNMPLA
jgi:hypothetical protein